MLLIRINIFTSWTKWDLWTFRRRMFQTMFSSRNWEPQPLLRYYLLFSLDDERKAKMLEKTVYLISAIFSQRFAYVGKLYRRGLNMNLHHNHICGMDLSLSAPRDLSGIKPQIRARGRSELSAAIIGCSWQKYYSRSWAGSCLPVPLHRNENNSGFCNKGAVIHLCPDAEFVSVSGRIGCQVSPKKLRPQQL